MVGSLKKALFGLRASVFLVMLVWTLDKFLNPAHTQKVFSFFYKVPFLSVSGAYIIGAVQLLIILAFLLGVQKKYSYGAVLGMHLLSTISSWMIFLSPWAVPNILFWAAFPMLAACYALFVLRDEDTLYTVA